MLLEDHILGNYKHFSFCVCFVEAKKKVGQGLLAHSARTKILLLHVPLRLFGNVAMTINKSFDVDASFMENYFKRFVLN
jgi:hypothetical protein